MTLSDALDIFSDNLAEIKEALASNILADISKEVVETTSIQRYWIEFISKSIDEPVEVIEKDLYDLRVKELVDLRSKTIKRIVAKLEPPKKGYSKITDEDIERAKEVPIEDMITTRRFKATNKWRSNYHCPLSGHAGERTPSFYIDKKNRYKCFGCQEHGSSIDFYMDQNGLSKKDPKNFITAVKQLINL